MSNSCGAPAQNPTPAHAVPSEEQPGPSTAISDDPGVLQSSQSGKRSASQMKNICKYHTQMIVELGDMFSPKQWRSICNQVKMRKYVSTRDMGDVETMEDLCIALQRNGIIRYGEYSDLREILVTSDVEAGEIIDTFTRKINQEKEGPSPAKQPRVGNPAQQQSTEILPELKNMIETAKDRIKKEKEEKKFYPTKGFQDAKGKLQKKRVVVIKGNTGDGKTAIAVQLIHWLQEQQAGQPLQIHNIKKLDLLAPNLKLITFIDDIFGEKEVCKKDVEEWNKRISDVETLFVDKEANNFLVITIRNEVYNSLKTCSRGTIFTDDHIIDLSSDTYKIEEEKKGILELYKPIEFLWSDEEKDQIVKCAPNIGFPQCCQLFCNSEDLQKERAKFFENPFHFLNEALSKLKECSALLYLFFNDGKIRVKDLDPNSQNVNKELLEEAFDINLIPGEDDSTELKYKKKVSFVKESLQKLSGFLVMTGKHRSHEDVYRFHHDSIYVAVALLYGKATPVGYIQNCPSKCLRYLTTSETATNTIVISSDHYTEMCVRLLREFECEERYEASVGSLDVWKDSVFVKRFVGLLNERKVDKLAVLNKACKSGAEECALYLLCEERVKPDKDTVFCVLEGGSIEMLRKLLEYDVTPTARDRYNDNVLHEACWRGREEMVTLLCNTYPHLVLDTGWSGLTPLHHVAQERNLGLFQMMERFVLNSLYRVENQQIKCESVDGCVVHKYCVCAQYMSQLVGRYYGGTVLHHSCGWSGKVNREVCLYLCRSYPGLTTIVDELGRHFLHHIAMNTSDLDVFTECEIYVKQYIESTGGKYDVTTILNNRGKSVLDLAMERAMFRWSENNPLLEHLVKVFGK